MDGRFIAWAKANIHILTHSLHYGAGVFEGIRFYETPKGPAIFRLKEHVKRLFYSASCVDMKIPFTPAEVEDAILNLVKKNRLKSGYIRPLAYFGYGKMGLNPSGSVVNLAIACWPWGSYLGEKPVKCKISKFIRIHPLSTKADAKICGHYVNSILASLEIHKEGFDEAILLDYKGNIAEGPGENIFLVKNGVLLSPKEGNILPGITRDSIMKIAADNGIKVKMQHIRPGQLLTADEAFYTGTAAEITAISHVDGKRIANGKMGPITKILKNQFFQAITGHLKKYEKWLSYA